MKSLLIRCAFAGLGLSSVSSAVQAQADTSPEASPLHAGAYLAPMGSLQITGEHPLKTGGGGLLNLGFRRDWYALELGANDYRLPAGGSHKVNQFGATLNGLVFPFASSTSALVQNAFGILQFGELQNLGFPSSQGDQKFYLTTFGAGAGDLYPISFGRYEFAIRAEALFRYGRRAAAVNLANGDFDAPNAFKDVLVNIGLQLPLTLKPVPLPPPAEPVSVAPPPPADTDGDGVTDDLDQCPGTPAGTKVDAKGCPLPPPCKPPVEGEKLDLSGCGTGDVIVLRGVNFEFNQSRLTPNAKTILDDVAVALLSQPALHVEVGGHTDSKGSDAYNLKLSDHRAAAVVKYLVGKGIAADHLSSAGYGETQPVADNDTDEGRELNRRVELKITGRDEAVAPASVSVPAAAPATAETPAVTP